MSNVLVDKTKLDYLANAISNKSGEALTLTLDEMVSAVDGIETGGGGITPTGNIDITSAGTTDVTQYATATVAEAEGVPHYDTEYNTYNGNRRWALNYGAEFTSGGWVDEGVFEDDTVYPAIPTGTSVTPTESAQTIGGANTMLEGAVTVNAIPSNYVGSGITQRTSSDLTASGATVTAPSGYYASSATKTVASGTEGTPTATKGNVSNHAISVTPSVTNSAGYISGGTHNGTAVTVSASELVSGNLPITQNGDNIDVTNYATVSVNVSGGGGSDVQFGFSDIELSSASSSIAFSGLSGEPTSFVIWAGNELTTGASPYKVAMVVYDGTNVIGQTITNTNNAQVTYDSSSFSYTYNSGTLTVTSTGAYFQPIIYLLDFTYGGTSGNIQTADVQVGSGATSITFTNLDDEPVYWSCIFKSNFSTSSGYQRVIGVVHDDEGSYGLEMDSSAKYSDVHWTATYNNGSLTITSQSTNAGGYFHQPGYYQLTYAISGDQTLQTKTVTPTESTQNVTADTAQGYTALKKVVVNPIPSSYVQPTATKGATNHYATTSDQTIASGTYLTGNQTIKALSQTNLSAENIKSGTTITINNGNANVWSVTGTYSGGGGGTDRLVLLQTTSLGTLSTSSTSATDTGKTVSLAQSTGWQNYDLLLVDISVDTTTNGRHTSTVTPVILTGTSNVSTKNTYTVVSNRWNSKLGSTGTASTRQSTTAYGVYINSASVSSNTLSMTVYYRYNSNSTGTLNGTYTARVYGIKLIDLIGG